ncbi:MAG: hypothetical protein HN816_05405, partial [Gammaproteobacteria bacterium]|nr:hypothetical protein [Gammaproteobacteria bacterium]
MENYTCLLSEIDANSLAQVGGKGANLGELVRANLPVPAAFCVNTEAYRQQIESNSLLAPVLNELEGLDYDNPLEIESRAKKIREMIVAAEMPADIDEAIRKAYSQLESELGENVEVSVRSSATLEDLPGASFAGQQDTYLNIQGSDAVISHVKQCWASLWTDRAISYRQRQGFAHEEVLLAVVVQEMFPSEVAGVMFTVNPVTSNPDEIFLNLSWGLGEAIVSGKVNPDQYIIDKEDQSVKDRTIQEKLVMTVGRSDSQGSMEVDVPEELRKAETLTDDQLRELAKIGLRIEKHYGFPQDIEWGFANGRFAILQAREVTAADIDFRDGIEAWQTPIAKTELTSDKWTWSRAYSDELQTGPSTPLMYSMAQPHRARTKFLALEYMGIDEFAGYKTEQLWDMPVFRWYGARAYYNTSIEKEWIRRFIPPFARDDIALSPFPEEMREEIRNMPFDWMQFAKTLVKLEWTHPTRGLLGSTHYLLDNFEDWIRHSDEVWNNVDLETASVREIFEAMQKSVEGNELEPNVAMPFNVFLYWLPQGLERLCEMWCDDENAQIFSHLVSGLQTPTGEQNIAVWELSRKVKASPVLTELIEKNEPLEILNSLGDSADGKKFKKDFDVFIRDFGHRGAEERDAYHFRWQQKPERVFPSIKALLAQDDEDSPARFEERLHLRMLETKKACLKKIRQQPLGALKSAFFKWYLELVQEYFYYRDWERYQNDKNGVRRRPMYCAIGRRFVERGLMQDEEDIFFIGMGEMMELETGKLTARDVEIRVRARRRVYAKYTNREPPKYLRGWETSEDNQLSDDGQNLRGIPASSGTVTGRARVCRSLDQIGRVEKGDILITVATDPAWTTVFSII